MFSKIIRPCRLHAVSLLSPAKFPLRQNVRAMWGIPPSQYDTPWPDKLKLGYAMRVYWELIPVVITSVISIGLCVSAIIWACKNKVDVVYTTNSRANISRTMNLRQPTVHKIRIVNQRYEPWPEMQDVLDKMTMAEKRALVRMQSCSHA